VLLPAGLLLAGDGALRTLAGTRVGLGALSVHGKATAVPQALVATDLDLAADVRSDLTAEVTLELVVALEVVAQDDERRMSGLMPVAASVWCARVRPTP
jgi:hypothetical protein